MKNFGDVDKMKNRDWIEVLILKCKHENYPIEHAIDSICKYVALDLQEQDSQKTDKEF